MKLKICGITNSENAEQISKLNVNFLGLIFAKSPRKIGAKKACELSKIIHKNHKKVVGVFVDESDDFILEMIKNASLDVVQIYKIVSSEFYARLKAYGVKVWQVIRVKENLQMPANLHADMILFDAKGEFMGGNGICFEWSLLESFKGEFGLAGGINADNFKKALNTKASVIDVNSGVESEVGVKDIEKIKQILKEIK